MRCAAAWQPSRASVPGEQLLHRSVSCSSKRTLLLCTCLSQTLRSPHFIASTSSNHPLATTFESMHERFMRLYSRRAMLHHYTQVRESGPFRLSACMNALLTVQPPSPVLLTTQYTDGGGAGVFDEASESLVSLADSYRQLQSSVAPSGPEMERYVPMF